VFLQIPVKRPMVHCLTRLRFIRHYKLLKLCLRDHEVGLPDHQESLVAKSLSLECSAILDWIYSIRHWESLVAALTISQSE
jgi:hypothetical protein